MRVFLLSILFLLHGCAKQPNKSEIPYVEINEPGIHARHFSLAENINRPIIILLSGSGGPYMRGDVLYGIVQNGYDVFSTAYFGQSDQPREIEHVPIEYVDNAIKWLRDTYPRRKIVVMGVSKGAEMALLYASEFDNLDGLICYAPSSIVIPNHVTVAEGNTLKSSWTFQGKEVPFAPLNYFTDPAGPVAYRKYIDPILAVDEVLQKSRIVVEKIQCPVLLLAGKDDQVWPSYEMAKMIYDTLKNANADVVLKAYENGGHQFFWFGEGEPDRVSTRQTVRLTGIKKHSFSFGGTIEDTRKAMMQSKKDVLEFLEKM